METNLSRMMEARINPQLEDVELNDDGTEHTEEQFQEMIEKVRALLGDSFILHSSWNTMAPSSGGQHGGVRGLSSHQVKQ